MLVSAHSLYLNALCALHIQIKPFKYRCALDIKAPNYRALHPWVPEASAWDSTVITQDLQNICIIPEWTEA